MKSDTPETFIADIAKANIRIAELRCQRDEAVRELQCLVNACTTGTTDRDGKPMGVRIPEKEKVDAARSLLSKYPKP
jgi:hypothetical protein